MKDGGGKRGRQEGRPPSGRAYHAAAFLAILVVAGAVYGSTLSYPFFFDDRINITENPYIRMTELSAGQVRRAVVQDSFQMRFVSNFTFALDHYFHGLDRRVMRLENIALHAVSALFVYLVLAALIPGLLKDEPGKWRLFAASLLPALIWAAHPAHTQAVTYIVQRQTVMATLGGLAAFYFYIRARTGAGRMGPLLYALSVLFFIVSAGSKEIGFTVPAVILLFELLVMRGGGSSKRLLIPAAAVLVAFISALLLLAGTGVLESYMSGYKDLGYGPLWRMITECRVLISYFFIIIFPRPSMLSLEHDVVPSGGILTPWTTLPSLLIVAGIIAAAILLWKRRPLFSFLVLSFFATLAPESTFIPVELMNDQRMYMPSLFVIVPLAAWFVTRVPLRKSVPVALVVLVAFSAAAHLRNREWSSRVSIWKDSAEKAPEKYRPWSNLCAALIEEGRAAEALPACRKASRLSGGEKAFPLVNTAISLIRLGRAGEAEQYLRSAAEVEPDSALARYNLGVFLEKTGELEEAYHNYRQAIEADAFHADARIGAARILAQRGQKQEALRELETVLKLFPGNERARAELDQISRDSGAP